MKKQTMLAVALTTIGFGVFAAPAIAEPWGKRFERMEHVRDGDRGRRGHADWINGMFESYDANSDGEVTQEEINTVRAERLAEFDTDGDSQLTLDEYQALWLDAMRERMVDQFQRHDDDGDGFVTVEEFGEDFARIVERRDRNGDGVLSADDLRQRLDPGREDAE